MKKTIAAILALVLTLAFAACAFAADTPLFMTPAVFAERFNTIMNVMADRNAESLGPEAVEIIKESYTLVQDDPQGQLLWFGNSDWSLEAGFLFAGENDAEDGRPAVVVSMKIGDSVPDVVVTLARFSLMMIIGYDFQDEVSTDDLQLWFDTAREPSDTFALPGYTLSVIRTGDSTQYLITAPADRIPQLNNGQF